MDPYSFQKEHELYTTKIKEEVYTHLAKNFDHKFIEKLLDIAAVSIEGYIKAIESDVKYQDIQGLLNTFHAFQGMLINLGLGDEAKKTKKIQKLLKEKALQSTIPEIEKFIIDITHYHNALQTIDLEI